MSAAVIVLVIDPIRNWMSGSGQRGHPAFGLGAGDDLVDPVGGLGQQRHVGSPVSVMGGQANPVNGSQARGVTPGRPIRPDRTPRRCS
jgi:hypothetical protein